MKGTEHPSPNEEGMQQTRKRLREEENDDVYKHQKIGQKDVLKSRRSVSTSLLFDLNLNDHHTQPFDDCVTTWIKDIILNHGNIETVFKDEMYCLTLSNYRFIRDTMMPSDAHTYNSSYAGTILVDIRELVLSKNSTTTPSQHDDFPFVLKDITHPDMVVCQFPIMLYSNACHFSEGYDLASQN